MIRRIETRAYRFPFDPPFHAAWDPVPRTHQDATLVIVHDEDGRRGYASGGDGLPDRDLLDRLLRGVDPGDATAVREICETVDFHGGRPWAVDAAVADLAARRADAPLWRHLGGGGDRLTAYASSGEPAGPDERAARVAALRDRGLRAVKLRFHHDDWRADVEVAAAVREAVGPEFEILVDANQGWRMPGDRTPAWDVGTAAACAAALEPLNIRWLEEPLPTGDVAGYAKLTATTGIPVAAGEMVRTAHEARDLVERGGVAVIQCDVVLSLGIDGCRRLAAGLPAGRTWSPHTWSNGLGLLANLHAACAFSTCPLIEVPLDPPAWPAGRRDWQLPAPLEVDADGSIAPPPGPGLGVEPDLEALERWRTA